MPTPIETHFAKSITPESEARGAAIRLAIREAIARGVLEKSK